MDQERLFYLVSFIQGDIEGAMQAAFKEAVEKQIRHRAGLEAVAQEASLSINQVLLGAKREFGIGGLEAETPLDEATRDALAVEIEAIDASYGLPTILDLLAEQLGIRFMKETRQRLEGRILEELARKGQNVETLQGALSLELENAHNRAQAAISDRELLRMVEEDLGQLRAFYLDPEFLRARGCP